MRFFEGSNFPVDRLFESLDTLFDSYRLWLRAWESDQQLMLHDNAVRLYRLDAMEQPERKKDT